MPWRSAYMDECKGRIWLAKYPGGLRVLQPVIAGLCTLRTPGRNLIEDGTAAIVFWGPKKWGVAVLRVIRAASLLYVRSEARLGRELQVNGGYW